VQKIEDSIYTMFVKNFNQESHQLVRNGGQVFYNSKAAAPQTGLFA
jgi:hypothetical protein